MTNEEEAVNVKLSITGYGNLSPPNEIELYGAGVKFFSYWFAKQSGALGMDTEALFEEFKQNVCKAMAAGTKGTG